MYLLECNKHMAEAFLPKNELEALLIKVHNNQESFDEFVQLFFKSNIAVPSGTEMEADGSGMTPLLFDKNDISMLGIFTDISKVSLFKDKTPYCLSMNGFELFSRIPNGYGLVVNPGYDVGFDLTPEAIKNILNQ